MATVGIIKSGIIKSACCARVLVKTPVYFRITLRCIDHSTGPCISLVQASYHYMFRSTF